MDPALARRVLAERKARTERAGREAQAQVVADKLRAWYYPRQAAYLTSKAKRRATRKTRRSGATTGGCREFLAAAITIANYRQTYCNETKEEARKLAWESDTRGGMMDLVREYGRLIPGGNVPRYDLGGVTVDCYDAMVLEFSNGSQIDFFCADDENALERMRGRAKHRIWIDEAQKFRHLRTFYKGVVVGALTDFQGECWLSGTPSKLCADMFFEVTKDLDEEGPPLPGWEVHELAVTDNPYFGATAEERWERTAGAALVENGWTPDDPDFLREWRAQWVKTDALYVYAVHRAPPLTLTYAPQRMRADGYPDVLAALEDLPGWTPDPKTRREYLLGLGADLGTFAWVVGAWSQVDPVLYEVASWKKAGLDYDEMAEHLRQLRELVHIGLITADAGGGGKQAVMGWSKKWVERYQIPIIEATKTNKHTAIDLLNTDIRNGHVRFRVGSTWLAEAKVHRWLAPKSAGGKLVEDPATDNHACDAGLYLHRESYHYRWREASCPPAVGSAEYIASEEAELEHAACDQDDDPYAWR